MTRPGFYSVVQFVPDIERGEAVNVGVIVGSPGLGMRVRMAERNEYVKQWFGTEAYDETRLGFAKSGLAERLKDVEPSAEALAMFRSQEAGQLQLTPPRPMVVKNLDDDMISLFLRLVSDSRDPASRAANAKAGPSPPSSTDGGDARDGADGGGGARKRDGRGVLRAIARDRSRCVRGTLLADTSSGRPMR